MRSTIAKLAGLAMLAVAVAAVATVHLPRVDRLSDIPWWLLAKGLAPVRILPLVGFGVVVVIVGIPHRTAAFALLLLGFVAGFFFKTEMVFALEALSAGTDMFPLTEAGSLLLVGLALLSPKQVRPWSACLAATVLGLALAVAIEYLAPPQILAWEGFEGEWVGFAGGFTVAWIVAAVALTLTAFRRSWFPVGARVLGSWLVAIGLLYGGASLVPKPAPPIPPPSDQPDFDDSFPDAGWDLPLPDRYGLSPDRIP